MLTGPLVVKVGGSLLDWPNLSDRLSDLLPTLPRPLLLVCGGGQGADWIRNLDALHHLPPEVSHHLAIQTMDLSAQALAAMVPAITVVDNLYTSDAFCRQGAIPVLAPSAFLRAEADRPNPLPVGWAVTSDTIAARLAHRLGAAALLLLKSASLPRETRAQSVCPIQHSGQEKGTGSDGTPTVPVPFSVQPDTRLGLVYETTRQQAARAGLLDAAFVTEAAGLSEVWYLNLRDPTARLTRLPDQNSEPSPPS